MLAMTFSYFVVCPFDFAQDRGAYWVLIQRGVDCVRLPDFSTTPSASLEMTRKMDTLLEMTLVCVALGMTPHQIAAGVYPSITLRTGFVRGKHILRIA